MNLKIFLVVSERKNGLTQLFVQSLRDNNKHYLTFDEETYTVSSSTNVEYNTDVLRYGYSSLITPSSTYDYNMKTKNKELKKTT